LNIATLANSSAANGGKDTVHPEPEALPGPGKRPRATKKKAPPAANMTPTRVTWSHRALASDGPEPQCTTEQDTSVELVELDLESTPKAFTHLETRRKAKAEFIAMLSKIAEEPDFNEADRTVGGYEWNNDDWEAWKRGSDGYDGEYEEDDGVGDDDGGFETSTSVSTATSQVTRNSSAPKITTNKPKCKSSNPKTTAGKSKRKDRSDTDSEDKCDGEFVLI